MKAEQRSKTSCLSHYRKTNTISQKTVLAWQATAAEDR